MLVYCNGHFPCVNSLHSCYQNECIVIWISHLSEFTNGVEFLESIKNRGKRFSSCLPEQQTDTSVGVWDGPQKRKDGPHLFLLLVVFLFREPKKDRTFFKISFDPFSVSATEKQPNIRKKSAVRYAVFAARFMPHVRVRCAVRFAVRELAMVKIIVHYDTSAMKRFLTSVSLQHEPKASDVITLVKKTFVRTSVVGNFISRGVKMRISAREACVKPHLRTRSDIKKIPVPIKVLFVRVKCSERSVF